MGETLNALFVIVVGVPAGLLVLYFVVSAVKEGMFGEDE